MRTRVRRSDEGAALVVVCGLLLVVSTLSAATLLSVSTESKIAAAFQLGVEGRHAADAAAELALVDLGATVDWNTVLDGTVRSSFTDGPPTGPRTLGGVRVDLSAARHVLNCGHAAACTDADLDLVTAERPWGPNNPRWQLYAYGPLGGASAAGDQASRFYVAVFVADDPSETDGNPLRDAAGPTDPGRDVVWVRAEAYGPSGARRAVELIVARTVVGAAAVPSLRVASWRRVS